MHNALSHELRYAIYRLFEKEELCTCALAEIVQMSEPTITHHLKILSDAGLIIAEKRGLFTVYFTKENFHKKNMMIIQKPHKKNDDHCKFSLLLNMRLPKKTIIPVNPVITSKSIQMAI